MKKKLRNLVQRVIIHIIGWSLNFLAFIWPTKAGDLALDLFCSPQGGQAKPHQLSFLESAKYQTITIHDRSVQMYRWPGNGEKVILLHGWDSNSYRWKTLLPYLQQLDLDVYAFDAHAHGLSEGKRLNVPLYTEILNKILEEIPVKILIGHSMGAMTSIYHQFLHSPPSVNKIISLGAPSELSTIMDTYKSMLGFTDRLMKALESRIIKRFKMQIVDFSMARFASKLSITGLVIHDLKDETASIEEGRSIAKNWNSASLLETDGLGHRLQGKEVYEAILKSIQ